MIFPCLAYADLMDPSPTLTLHPVVRFTLAHDSFFFFFYSVIVQLFFMI